MDIPTVQTTQASSQYVHRHIEQSLPSLLATFPTVILTGPRQVGKTTLLRHALPKDYSFVTLDDIVTRQQAAGDPAMFLLNNPGRLFIDEVQYAPELFSQLKIAIDQQPGSGLFVLSGSQRYSLMGKASESLAGRIAMLELQGYSLREVAGKAFHEPFIANSGYYESRRASEREYAAQRSDGGIGAATGDSIWSHIHRGALPRLQNQAVDWEQYYSAYVQTYIERDVRQLAQVGDSMAFHRFLVAMAARTGELLSYSNVSRDVGVSVDTVRRWTAILQASGLIEIIAPYANSALKRAIRTPKLYFLDTGLACFLTGWTSPEVLRRGAKAGSIFETFVVSEIIKSWQNAGKGIQRLSFFRDKQGNEIDLLITDNDVVHPVEIKMTARPDLGMRKAFSCLDNLHDAKRGLGAIICLRPEPLYLDKDVLSLPVSFL